MTYRTRLKDGHSQEQPSALVCICGYDPRNNERVSHDDCPVHNEQPSAQATDAEIVDAIAIAMCESFALAVARQSIVHGYSREQIKAAIYEAMNADDVDSLYDEPVEFTNHVIAHLDAQAQNGDRS